MAGMTGLEPAASAVTVLRATAERMRRSERKLHACNRVGHFSPSTTRTEQHQFTPLCKGMDTRVTSQLMSQTLSACHSSIGSAFCLRTFMPRNVFRPGLSFRQGVWPLILVWEPGRKSLKV
jgi:hypothetical protein